MLASTRESALSHVCRGANETIRQGAFAAVNCRYGVIPSELLLVVKKPRDLGIGRNVVKIFRGRRVL